MFSIWKNVSLWVRDRARLCALKWLTFWAGRIRNNFTWCGSFRIHNTVFDDMFLWQEAVSQHLRGRVRWQVDPGGQGRKFRGARKISLKKTKRLSILLFSWLRKISAFDLIFLLFSCEWGCINQRTIPKVLESLTGQTPVFSKARYTVRYSDTIHFWWGGLRVLF